MGEVISMVGRRRARPRGDTVGHGRPATTFAFDLSSPFTYLAAERVERLLGGAAWAPVLDAGPVTIDTARAERRAAALGMPLVWPEVVSGRTLGAARVASYAAESGRASVFAVAAGRLAFCGGFDLDDPEILAEAIAAAGLPLDASIDAMGDAARDEPMVVAGRRLAAHGAGVLPVLRVGRALFAGEERVGEAAAAARTARAFAR